MDRLKQRLEQHAGHSFGQSPPMRLAQHVWPFVMAVVAAGGGRGAGV
jgi:hypothetical protein